MVLGKKTECLAKQSPPISASWRTGKPVGQSGRRELQLGLWHLQAAKLWSFSSPCPSPCSLPTYTNSCSLPGRPWWQPESKNVRNAALWCWGRHRNMLFTRDCSKYSLVQQRAEVWNDKGNRERSLAFSINCRRGGRLFTVSSLLRRFRSWEPNLQCVHLVRLLTHLGEINNSPFIHRYGVYLLELLCLIRSFISCALEKKTTKKALPSKKAKVAYV